MMFRAVRTKVFKDLGNYIYLPGIVAPRTTGAKLLCARLLCSKMETDYKPPARLLKPITVPDRLLCGPGPSNCPPRILKAASLPLVGHLHPECLEIMDDIKAGLQYAFQTTNTLTIAVSGTGHAGMEAAMVNVVESGDRVLVLKHGIWGIRAQDIAERCGAVVQTLEHPPGQVFTLDEVEEGLEKHKPAVLFVCHGESSAGTCQPLEGLGELCHRNNCLLLVDTVASLGGVPFYMDKWGVDVVYSGSQKVLSAPPSTAPISFSPRARDKMAARKKKVQSFYFDMEWLAEYWGVDNSPRVYHHTGPVSALYALREAVAMLSEEGLETCWKRHRTNAELLWSGLKKLGVDVFVEDERVRLPTINSVKIPPGIDWGALCAYIMKKHSIEISGGLGPTKGKVGRIGIMGYNSSPETVQKVLQAVEDGLKHCREK